VLTDLDETIKEMLVKGVPLDTAEIDVAFEAPTAEWSASLARPTVNCYLYHLVENQDLRHNQWELDRNLGGRRNGTSREVPGVTRRRMPFRLDACYMVTAWANAPEDEHRLLWRVIGALMRYNTIPVEYLKGSLVGQEWPFPTKTAQPDGPIKNPSDFWSSMEGPIRAGFHYVVTLPLDPEWVAEVPLVLTRRMRTRLGTGDSPPDELPTVQFGGWVRQGAESDAVVPGAQVLLVERGLQVLTDAAGRFAFDRVPRGRYTLRATTETAQAERTIEVPGAGYDLVLPDPGAPAAPSGPVGPLPTAPSDEAGPPPAPPATGKSRRR
jgi:hypothetical protein